MNQRGGNNQSELNHMLTTYTNMGFSQALITQAYNDCKDSSQMLETLIQLR